MNRGKMYGDAFLDCLASAYKDALSKGKTATASYILNVAEQIGIVRVDGGPGSGNHGHAGVPGQLGGSAPSGAARCTKSVEKIAELKKNIQHLNPNQKTKLLSRAGVISKEAESVLLEGAKAGDEVSLELIEEAAESYFYMAEYGREPKSLEVEMRDDMKDKTPEEKTAWVDQMERETMPPQLNQYSLAQKVAYGLCMFETPQVVCQEEFEEYVKESGATVMFRGVGDTPQMSAEQMQYQMAYDTQNPYFGDGVYGDGLYFSTRKETAEGYANGGTVSRCALRPDAKVYDYSIDDEAKWLHDTGRAEASVWAMLNGYDAIRVKQGRDEHFIVILNKAAMIMEDPIDRLQDAAIKAGKRNASKS